MLNHSYRAMQKESKQKHHYFGIAIAIIFYLFLFVIYVYFAHEFHALYKDTQELSAEKESVQIELLILRQKCQDLQNKLNAHAQK